MLTTNNQFENELKKRVDEERSRISEVLTAGHAIKTFDDYRFHVGQYLALTNVIDQFCDEVTTTINKR